MRHGLVFLFFVLAFFTLGAGLDGAGEQEPVSVEPSVQESMESIPSAVPPSYTLVASNELLELWVDKGNARVGVRDKRNGKWWGMPETEGRKLRGGRLWREHMSSLFVLTYTDDKRRQLKTTNNIREQTSLQWHDLEEGVRVTCDLAKLGVKLTAELRLNGDRLVVSVPDEEIIESPQTLLVTLNVMPFFGATEPGASGYMFFPDGSGAISYFKPEPGEYNRGFAVPVYGEDDVGEDRWSQRPIVVMPVFGIKEGDGAFLGVVTEGDFESIITVAPAGLIVDFNRASAEFYLRKQYSAPIRFDTFVTTYEKERIRSPRVIEYFFLTGDEADYSGMAARYRQYLIDTRGLGKMQGNVRMNLGIFCAAVEEALFGDRIRVVTTFAQARQMLEDLRSKGVTDLEVTLVGWDQGGYNGSLPHRLPPEEAIGGVKGLKELASYAEALDIPLYLRGDYMHAFAGNRGFSPRRDVVRGPDNLPRTPRDGLFVLSPEFVRESCEREFEQLDELGAAGIDFSHVGRKLLSDSSRYHRQTRVEAAQSWLNIVRDARNVLGKTAVEGANIYALGEVDRIGFVPILDSTYQFADETIPFYQMVVHGLVPYHAYAGNLRSDPKWEYLRMLEFGALPFFELSHEHSSLLRDSNYNGLFSSQFSDWVEVLVREYKVMQELKVTSGEFIIDHSIIAPGVRETSFEGGTRVVVNYNESDYVLSDEVVIGALDYVIIQEGDGV